MIRPTAPSLGRCWGRCIARSHRKRWHGPVQPLVMFLVLVALCFTLMLFRDNHPHLDYGSDSVRIGRSLLEDSTTETPANATNKTKNAPLFPPDIFTEYQLKHGAIVLHCLGMVYMFVALAMVCDEFFVPALDVIIDRSGISEDVAGATFMAAGGSAPELFTSIIGVFISFDDVGIGTIVGSAVFNILFVIAMCVLFSKTVLELTWWPLFRDVTFYSVALLMLVYFFLDEQIIWYEALAMLSIYILYCAFMKINGTVEGLIKQILNKNKVTRVGSTDQLVPDHQGAVQALQGPPGGPVAPGPGLPLPGLPGLALAGGSGMRRPSAAAPVIHSGSKFRSGLLQLMIHTIDPLHDGQVDEKAEQLHAMASLKVLLDAQEPQNGRVSAPTSAGSHEVHHLDAAASSDALQHNGEVVDGNNVSLERPSSRRRPENNGLRNSNIPPIPEDEVESAPATPLAQMQPEQMLGGNPPIDLRWPDTMKKRITYILVAPIILPLYATLADTRSARGRPYFVVTFFGSIIWIAIFSYMMVWWATTVGVTVGIPPPVMGLTILAAGTSVPDLITSVIVARKGFGDMAVSSSVGSNIFDVCVGLPVPWLIKALIDFIKNLVAGVADPGNIPTIEVKADGIACSVMLLFTMLMFVIISIAVSRWKMSKSLGFFMFFLYFCFVAISLLFSYNKLTCPI